MAWKPRIHFMFTMTGHRVSPEADCRAVAARMPGATNTRYSTPSTELRFSSTRPPSPMPSAPRNSRGTSTPATADVRQNRSQVRASRSVTRSIGTRSASAVRASLIERPPREVEEDVLQRAAPDQDRLGLDPGRSRLPDRLVAVGGVHQHAVGQGL